MAAKDAAKFMYEDKASKDERLKLDCFFQVKTVPTPISDFGDLLKKAKELFAWVSDNDEITDMDKG